MISPQKLANAIRGVGTLYKFDQRAWEFFDKTPHGFWSAYIVAFAVAPLQFIHRIMDYNADDSSLTFAPYLTVQVLAYILNWTLFPFAMIYIARLLGRTERYFHYMTPYIWMQAPLSLLLFTSQVLGDFGILPQAVLEVVDPMVLIAYAVFGTYVAGIGLQITTGTALSLVVLDFVLSQLAFEMISRI